MPKLRHYDHLGTARFLTFSTYQRRRILTMPVARDAILEELASLRNDSGVRVLGYVIMPEHVHLVLLPPDDLRLGPVLGAFKARAARCILNSLRSDVRHARSVLSRPEGTAALWQRRCYDHNCRTPEIVVEKIKYCHDSPVKRGLVSLPEDWPWSSYRWYLGLREGVPRIDGIEM